MVGFAICIDYSAIRELQRIVKLLHWEMAGNANTDAKLSSPRGLEM